MANCRVSDIIRDVRILMDMNGTDMQLMEIASPDTLEINELIKSNIEKSAKEIMMSAQTRLLGQGESMTSLNITWREKGPLFAGVVKLPNDFLRLITFKMQGWRNAVSEPIADDSPLYSLCHSAYGGIGGNPEQPIVAIVTGGDNAQELEFYSCENKEERIVQGRYLSIPKIIGQSTSGTLYFVQQANVTSKINEAGLEGAYEAVYNTDSKMFVFKKKDSLVLDYYKTCIDGDRYNDFEKKTVRQDVMFNDGKSVYAYDDVTKGLKKIADISQEIIDIPEHLYKDIVQRIALFTFLSLGDDNGARRMSDNLNNEQ